MNNTLPITNTIRIGVGKRPEDRTLSSNSKWFNHDRYVFREQGNYLLINKAPIDYNKPCLTGSKVRANWISFGIANCDIPLGNYKFERVSNDDVIVIKVK